MEKLNTQDIDTLIEAMDAWVNRGNAGEMMGDMLGAMLIKEEDDPDAFAKMKAERLARAQKRDNDKLLSQRKATILKAKLYELQAGADADGMIQNAMEHS